MFNVCWYDEEFAFSNDYVAVAHADDALTTVHVEKLVFVRMAVANELAPAPCELDVLAIELSDSFRCPPD